MKTDLYIGIFVVAVALLNLLGLLGMIGINGRFVDIVMILAGGYLIYKSVK